MQSIIPTPIVHHNLKWSSASNNSDFEQRNNKLEVWTFKPDFSIGLVGTAIDTLYSEIFPHVANKSKKGKAQAFKAAICTLSQASSFKRTDQRCGFIHSRSTSNTGTYERYKVCDFGNRVFTNVLDAMAEIGFVTYETGFKRKGYPQGLASIWWPTDAFSSWLEQSIDTIEIVSFRDSKEAIQLKHSKEDDNQGFKEYTDTSRTIDMRERVENGNLLRQQFKWNYLPLADERQFVEGDKRLHLAPDSLSCYRVFNGDFESGGRFYCGAQSLKKAERGTIEVDNLPTIELDFKSLHPRFLYNMDGLTAPADCYASDKRERSLTKQISLYSINCKSEAQAIKTLVSHTELNREDAKRHLEEYKEEHSLIAHSFFKSAWRKLQNLDSQLVDGVLTKASSAGIPILPVHDSFIVVTRDVIWLKEATEEIYRKMMKFDPVIDFEPMPELPEDLQHLVKF